MDLRAKFEEIQNIDFSDADRIGVWPVGVRAAFWVLTILVVVVGAYFFFVKDLNSELLRATQKEQQLRKAFEDKAFEAANLDDYRKQMVAMEEAYQGLLTQLPKETEVPGLLEDIEEKGEASGLNLSSAVFKDPIVGDFYVELPIEIKVQGDYHDLGTFVSAIAGMPRIVTLHDFQIQPPKEGRGLDMSVLAKTYRYKAQDEK